jgi:aspartyl-tRNA(Asn)/glutamyl-tRNA(Gln) amidotransferase subunit B
MEGEYRLTVGLEIHAELSTATKMFCACRNAPDEKLPNQHICPVCMAHPGALPVINKEAVHKVLLVGTALGGTLAQGYSEFDRKNYFYPDIPKGYQISQYQYPLVLGGTLKNVEVTRIHLEEDTARSQHTSTSADEDGVSLVDFNRAGVPLMELVTEPVIRSAAEAGVFARELQLLLRSLGASEANMEKGQMRVEANISVSRTDTLGTKVEVKNLNSFRSAERAIAYEFERQVAALTRGEKIIQETRGWDENKQVTFSQRVKESSEDYRYFPEPDLPKLCISELSEFSSETLRKELPELPWEKRENYIKRYGLKIDDADMLVREPLFGNFFDALIKTTDDTCIGLLAANYLTSDIAGKLERGELSEQWLTTEGNASRFGRLMLLIQQGLLSSRGAKEVLIYMFEDGQDPEPIAKEKGLIQESDTGTLDEIVKKVISVHPQVVEEYRTGKSSTLQFLVGQGMKESKGSANPQALQKQFEKALVK